MPEMTIHLDELPQPGEVVEVDHGHYVILVENTTPPSGTDETTGPEPAPAPHPRSGDVVRYVPVDTTSPTSVVRHAAAVYQRDQMTRVNRWALCSRRNSIEVHRRLDNEPITNVTCSRCRARLADIGLIGD